MNKFFGSLLVVTMLILSIGSVGLAVESEIGIGPVEALTLIKDQINALPVSAFTNPINANPQKQALLSEIDAKIRKIELGDYPCALRMLNRDLRAKIGKWIISTELTTLLQKLDNAIVCINNASKTTICTPCGKVAGIDAALDCWVWTKIPYAKPPVGNLRWKAPQDPTPWRKIRHSVQSVTPCTQFSANAAWVSDGKIKGSEDCLYLNIYRPQTTAKQLPVYFWIHGGSNTSGGADKYYSSNLAKTYNAVVVVIQYRVGPFGWFNHPALNNNGTKEEQSGNFGVLDQIKALQWVRQNIRLFGGNPDNITVAGESAGGFDTLNLMISPLAKGLFQRAFVESAGGTNVPVSTGITQANNAIDKLLVADGTCTDLTQAAAAREAMSNTQIEDYLKGKSDREILQAMCNENGSMSISPFIDGVVIPGTLESVFASGNYNHVPIVLGSNESEIKPFLPTFFAAVPTSSGYHWSNIYNALGLAEPKITLEQLMPTAADRALFEILSKYPSLYWKATRVDGLARLLKQHQDHVYCYYFKALGIGSGPQPFDYLIGAGHSFELPYFFGWPTDPWNAGSLTPENEQGRIALWQAMTTYGSSFAATGNPNRAGSGLPAWEEWSNQNSEPKCLIFDQDYTQAKIAMMSEEMRREEILAQINALPDLAKNLINSIMLW